MQIRAKFFVYEVDGPDTEGAARNVKLGAVCRGVENSIWAAATPSGNITMQVLNHEAVEQFEKGAEYEVVFRRVDKPQRGDGHAVKIAETKAHWLVCERCGHSLGPSEQFVADRPYQKDLVAGPIEVALASHKEAYGA